MADNIAITAGTGTTIATDDIGGGVHQQKVRMGGTATPYNVTDETLTASLTQPGNGTKTALVVEPRQLAEYGSQSPTGCSTSPAYSAGDAMGTMTQFVSFDHDNGDNMHCFLTGLTILDKTATGPDLDLWIFGTSVGTPGTTDNAAFAPADSYLAGKNIQIITVRSTDWITTSNSKIATLTPNIWLPAVGGSGYQYFQLVTQGAITLAAATDIVIAFSWFAV